MPEKVHDQDRDRLKGGLKKIPIIVLILDIFIYLASLIVGIARRFSLVEVRYLLFRYSEGFYLIVLLLSALSYIALYIYDSRGREELDTGASGENRSIVRRNAYRIGHDFIEQVKIVFRNHFVVFIALIVILFVTQASELLSRQIIAVTFLVSFIFDIIAREIVRVITQKYNDRQTKTVVVGGKILRIIPKGEKLSLEEEENKGKVLHVFAIGCKGIPAEYGGFETFMHNLTKYKQDENILYHVARMAEDELRYEYHRSVVFDIHVPSLGSAKAVYYDIVALHRSIAYCKKYGINSRTGKAPVFFIMACRIGPFIAHFRRRIHALGGKLYVNPDGHEWKRSKWSKPVQKYWKYSEGKMVKAADLIICDSKTIEEYIKKEYAECKPNTTFIAYGAKVVGEKDFSDMYIDWLGYNKVSTGNYYLMVGRFVPENNYEAVLREFMKSKTKRDLVIITTPNEKFSIELEKKLGWSRDQRIKFVGTVYNVDLLREIRLHAFAYIHGHSVGGTNPSLLESLGATDLNLLYECGFNREVAEDSALYFTTQDGSLAILINSVDGMSEEEREKYGAKAKGRIRSAYSWGKICGEYEAEFKAY